MEFQDLMLAGVSGIGFISLCYRLFTYLRWIYKMFIRSPKNLRDYGSWAIITGSTDGIGKALAFELAAKGLNLVCMGRNRSKLESTAAELRHKFGQRIKIQNIALDFDKSGPGEISSAIYHGIQGLDIGLLVNNVGIANSRPKFFHEFKPEFIESMVRVNVGAAIWVTRAVIPGMMKKKKGAIVNIGSGSSATVSSYPLFTLYAASKAFMATLSRSIGLEYQSFGIDIQCQAPLYISTKMITELGTNILIVPVESFSKSSVRWMGHNDPICCPFWWHSLQSYITRSLLDDLAIRYLFKTFLRMRREALEEKTGR